MQFNVIYKGDLLYWLEMVRRKLCSYIRISVSLAVITSYFQLYSWFHLGCYVCVCRRENKWSNEPVAGRQFYFSFFYSSVLDNISQIYNQIAYRHRWNLIIVLWWLMVDLRGGLYQHCLWQDLCLMSSLLPWIRVNGSALYLLQKWFQ